MKRKLLLLMICFSLIQFSYALDTPEYIEEAEVLEQLGLFKGTGNGFELERQASRTEAIVMLIRLIGKEDEALKHGDLHPFTDVPEWANSYVAYAFDNNLTNGLDETTFGANDPVSSSQFLTFILRSLGYNDREGDFTWTKALEFASEKKLINESHLEKYSNTSNIFLRDDCALISHNALSLNKKESSQTLIEHLVESNAIEKTKAISLNLIREEVELEDISLTIPVIDNGNGQVIIKGHDFIATFPKAASVTYATINSDDDKKIIESAIKSYQNRLFSNMSSHNSSYSLDISLKNSYKYPQMLYVYSNDNKIISHLVVKSETEIADSVTFVSGSLFDEDLIKEEAYQYTDSKIENAVYFENSIIDLSSTLDTYSSRTNHSIDLTEFKDAVRSRTFNTMMFDDLSNPEHMENILRKIAVTIKNLEKHETLPLSDSFQSWENGPTVAVDKNYNPSIIVLYDKNLNIIGYTFVEQ